VTGLVFSFTYGRINDVVFLLYFSIANFDVTCIAKPIEVKLQLSKEHLRALQSLDDFTDLAMAMLRVGDRITFQHDDRQWQIWKRHISVTDEFRQEVKVIKKGQKVAHHWPDDTVESIRAKAELGALADVALALHAARNPYPLVSLAKDQLLTKKQVIKRNAEDTGLVVVVAGGDQVKIGGAEAVRKGGVAVATFRQGRWQCVWTDPGRFAGTGGF
jgi:hypothetical protein